MPEIICVHYWTSWLGPATEEEHYWRKCHLCNRIQRKTEPEPRIVIAKIDG